MGSLWFVTLSTEGEVFIAFLFYVTYIYIYNITTTKSKKCHKFLFIKLCLSPANAFNAFARFTFKSENVKKVEKLS